jgi:hypothetical protein
LGIPLGRMANISTGVLSSLPYQKGQEVMLTVSSSVCKSLGLTPRAGAIITQCCF